MFKLIARLFGAAPRHAARSSRTGLLSYNRSRTLTLETFERRHALAGEILDPELPSAEPSSCDPAVELTAAPIAALTDIPDATPSAPTSDTSANTSPSPEVLTPPSGTTNNQPPRVIRFEGKSLGSSSQGSNWEFSGIVEDDHLNQGCTVVFSGLLSGKQVDVDRISGMFSLVVSLSINSKGSVSVIAVDADGKESMPASFYVP